jgi:hypothetical protein
MKANSDIINAKINAIEEKEADRALEKTIKISRKKIWLVVVISVLFPIGGYLYTTRWKALSILFGTLALTGAVIGAGSKNEEEAFKKGLELGSIIAPIAASLDNGLAISRARKKIHELV